VFSGVSGVSIQRYAVTASLDYRLSPTTTVGGGAGAGLGGLITVGAQRFRVLPGWELTGAWSRRILDGRGSAPFLLLGVSGGASGAATRQEITSGPTPGASSLYAFDVRVGLTVGKTFFHRLSPYSVIRAFGGPILWNYAGKTQVGGDLYHFQLGVGLVTALPRAFDVFVEAVPGGERALTLGAGKTF
jgi:hypothetical protein